MLKIELKFSVLTTGAKVLRLAQMAKNVTSAHFIKTCLLKVLLEIEIANFTKNTVKIVEGESELISVTNGVLNNFKLDKLYKYGAFLVKGEIETVKGIEEQVAIIYKGEAIAVANKSDFAKKSRDIIKNIYNDKKLVEVMETIQQTIKYENGRMGYVEGLYDAIDVLHKPRGFDFVDEILEKSNYGKQVMTEFYNSSGYFIRNFDKAKKIFTFNHGFLQDLPKWVTDVKIALVEGKGIPTQAYFTLRQMKVLGIAKGEIQIVKMAQIQNLETMGYIYKTMKEKGLTKLSEVDILAAPSNEYMKTVMIQAGYELRTAEIIEKGNYFSIQE